MDKKTLPVKGLNAPFLWCRGFLHGKLLHSGGLDPESNVITSGYITGQLNRFQSACILRMQAIEKKNAPAWMEADNLLIEYTALGAPPGSSKAEQRGAEKASARKMAILRRLSDIRNTVTTEHDLAIQECEATAKVLLQNFARYGHGLLLKPVLPANLPVLQYGIEQVSKEHMTCTAIDQLIKEAIQ